MAKRADSYTEAIAREICERLALGESLRQICKDSHMPSSATVIGWSLDDDKREFAERYARARRLQAEHFIDEIAEIADDGSNDWMDREAEKGRITRVADHEHIHRSKLRIDTRKWFASKVIPKVYGDRTSVELSGPDGGPIEVNDTEAAARTAQLLALAMQRKVEASDDDCDLV